MANPQTENGYTKIANELLEALYKIKLRDSERRIFYYIVRKTYGWNKINDKISISQISNDTFLSKRIVIYGLQNLEAKKMIKVIRTTNNNIKNINNIFIQKDYEKWVVQGMKSKYIEMLKKQRDKYKQLVVQRIDGSARNDQKVVQGIDKNNEILAHTKETIIKEIKIGEKIIRFSPPTKEEVFNYAKERKLNNPEKFSIAFIAHYDSKGWMIGKNKMKNWKQAVITWETGDWNIRNPVIKTKEEEEAEYLAKRLHRGRY